MLHKGVYKHVYKYIYANFRAKTISVFRSDPEIHKTKSTFYLCRR